MDIDLEALRDNLVNVLGDRSAQYLNALRSWFRGRITKEEFDNTARSLLPDDDNGVAIDAHNELFIAMLCKCQIRLASNKVGDMRRFVSGARTPKNQRFHTTRYEFANETSTQLVPNANDSKVQLCSVVGLLPDRSILVGRVFLAVWENGLRYADEHQIVALLHEAIERLLKNILQSTIALRRSHVIDENTGVAHMFGAKNVIDRIPTGRTDVPIKRTTIVPACSHIAVVDIIDTLTINPLIVPSNDLRVRLMERLQNFVD